MPTFFGDSKTSCRGTLIYDHYYAVGHDSLNVKEPFSGVNCKKGLPLYSRSCKKLLKEKEILTIHTQCNITCPEARKVVESKSPTTGIAYASVISKPKKKKYQSIRIQTEYISAIATPNHL